MTAVARATYNLKVAWSAYNLGLFTFDVSEFDSTDTLGVSPFDVAFGGPYDDVSALLAGGSWTRGSDDNMNRILAGSAAFQLRDPGGRFNPANPSSPLYGQIESRLHPCQLTATYAGTTYPLFYGWVRGDQSQPGNRRSYAALTCVDLFYWLDRAMPVIASTGTTTTGAAIGLILDAVGWIDPMLRDLDTGDTIPDFSADGSASATDLISGLLQAERGTFFHAGTGKATYRDRLAAFATSSVATIADLMSSIIPAVDFDLIQNRVTVTRSQNSYSAVAVDTDSANRFGFSDLPEITTPYLSTDAQADDLASFILSQVSRPKPPLYALTIDNRESALLTQILAREINDHVTVTESADGSGGDYILQQLQHTLDENANHSATYAATRASSLDPILFDTATFDGAAVFEY